MLKRVFLVLALTLSGGALRAQEPVPDGQIMGTKENRVLWIFPNYSTVERDKAALRISPMDKLRIATNDSFDPYAFPIAAGYAGLAQISNQYPSWGKGLDGYGKRYVGAFADQTVANMMAGAAFPVMLHQDPRYFRLGHGSFVHRAGYAVSRVFITRSDSGEAQFNYSEVGGVGVMAGFSNVYYPRQDRSLGNTLSKFGVQLSMNMLGNLGKEFWPDIKRLITK